MKVTENLRKKLVEVLAAATLIIGGIGFGAMSTKSWCQVAGSAMAAMGGALLSYTASDVNVRNKAVDHLKPELQAASRHLADTVTKLSRNIQAYQSDSLEADLAIDRVAQLTSSLYGTVNDLHILVGAPPDFQCLVETVSNCEEMAARLEQLTLPDHAEADGRREELDQLRAQLESARMQLASAQREFGNMAVSKTDEQVHCPYCGVAAAAKLGRNTGDSAMQSCSTCGERFHIHRGSDGGVFTRPWGGSTSATTHIEVDCPHCNSNVPLNFHIGKSHEERFCMACGALLRISAGGEVSKIGDAAPLAAAIARWASWGGGRPMLLCPQCRIETPSIWGKDTLVRAVCSGCKQLLEAEVRTSGSHSEMPTEGSRNAEAKPREQ